MDTATTTATTRDMIYLGDMDNAKLPIHGIVEHSLPHIESSLPSRGYNTSLADVVVVTQRTFFRQVCLQLFSQVGEWLFTDILCN